MSTLAPLPDGGRLSYSVIGDGPPLVLLRPLGGTMALWGSFATILAEHHRVIAFDPRGVGDSSAAPLACSTRGMAADAVALLDHLGVEKAHVFGLSLGGMVGSWLAIDAPERVERLVLASTLPRARALSRRAAGRAWSFLRCFASPWDVAEVALVRQVLSSFFKRTQAERVSAIEALVRAHPSTRANLVRLGLAAARHDAEPRLLEIGAPTLLVVGMLDPLVGPRAQTELVLGIPNARLEVMHEAGHDLSLEKPAELAERVMAFLSSPA